MWEAQGKGVQAQFHLSAREVAALDNSPSMSQPIGS